MISNIAEKITNKLIKTATIADTEQELYVYGFFILISQILYFIITTISGILLGIVLESVIFYISFRFIRMYAGGIHASTETKCEIATTVSIILCLLCIKLCKTYNVKAIILVLTIIAALSIFVLCPLYCPEKPLSKKEQQYFRKISQTICFLFILVVGIGWYFKITFLIYPFCLSLILESILLVLGKIKGLNKNNG